MNDKQESVMASLAAVLVLFATMLDPIISAGLAILVLASFAVYKYIQYKKK